MAYYIYAYLREDGTPYYIGKGRGRRRYSTSRTVPKPPKNRIIIMEENLTEIGALALERRYIRWYGRKDLNTGTLRNMTDGGDGTSGHTVSKEAREKIGVFNKGKNKSDEHKKKIGEGNKGKERPTLRQLNISRRGKPISDEHRKRISEARKDRKFPRTSPGSDGLSPVEIHCNSLPI
jgi:hypothetical protein